ncbi:rhodanese-like/PpiC domain-containing protein 12, chloroplastic isoform X1 [Cucurbita maxima]|uniref:Rhodanese-like/PpiC domain-containing protein 12, chloroplastic isoform X1 n=1 Tax=Cucurbita maxima TaxID=3661 RepID=A0A6J1K700_CUCMA|nr:rhodanese-like/PpiC domain-containing protein 12, chloroplastic isoform X1 [Cucurbita maxima]
MMRCGRLPPLASPVIHAFRRCWIPALCIAQQSFLHSASIYAPFCSYASKSFKHGQRLLIRPMSGHHPSSKVAASFSSAGGSEDGRELLVQHLLVKEDDIKLLSDLQQRIAGGDDLSDLAVEYSLCPSKEEGGMLGWVKRGQMVPEFEEAAFNAPLNKVVKCKTKFGWHLLQVLSERGESVLLDIQPEELHLKMQDPNFLNEAQLIDVREPEEVDQACLPAFQVLPLRQFGSWGPEVTTKFDPQKETYVMCHHGVRSLQVARYLQTQGFKKVYNVSGGIHAYSLKVDSSIPTY